MNSKPKFKEEIEFLKNRVLCEKRMIELSNRSNEITKNKHKWDEKLIAVLEKAEIHLGVDPSTASKEEAKSVFKSMTDMAECKVKIDQYLGQLKDLKKAMCSLASEHGFDYEIKSVSGVTKEG